MLQRAPGTLSFVTLSLLAGLSWVCLLHAQETDSREFESGIPSLSGTQPKPSTESTPGGQLRVPPLMSNSGSSPTQPRQQYVPLTGSEKWRYYVRSTYGPGAIAKSIAVSGINQARDTNPEWGQGMEGYAKRLGSKFGRHTVKHSVAQSLGVWWGEDPRYFHATSTGIMPRTFHAVSWVFITRKDDGGYKVADARLIGTFAGGMASRLWETSEDRTFRSGLESAGVSLAIDAGWNIFKEFWPDIRRRLRH